MVLSDEEKRAAIAAEKRLAELEKDFEAYQDEVVQLSDIADKLQALNVLMQKKLLTVYKYVETLKWYEITKDKKSKLLGLLELANENINKEN